MFIKIFDRRIPIFRRILKDIKGRKTHDKPFVIGINGIDNSGKTEFAKGLEDFLKEENYKTQLIELDDFHNLKKIRYSGNNEIDCYYNNSFNIETIINELLKPIHEDKEVNVNIKILDLCSDKYIKSKKYSVDKDTIVLLEGVFLFRKELVYYINYKIFLDVPFKESKKRARYRDISRFGKEIMQRYDNKYLPAQRKYLKEFSPLKIADLVINNTNWEYPVIENYSFD